MLIAFYHQMKSTVAKRRALSTLYSAHHAVVCDALSAMRSLKGIGATHLHEGVTREY